MFAIVNLIKHNHIIGLQDTAEYPGKFLINELIASNPKDRQAHVFCYDTYCQNLQAELNLLDSSLVHFHDCLLRKNCNDPLFEFLSSPSSFAGCSRKMIIIIDSLSTLLMTKKYDEVYRLLRRTISVNEKTSKTQIQVLALIHEDTLLDPDQILNNFKHLCRVWIQVWQDSLKVTIKKTSGKLVVQRYGYELTEKSIKILKKVADKPKVKSTNEVEDLPSSTFKLSLSENEKKAREAVQLPYERNMSESSLAKGGQILYEPDEYDDWDEEDPDNDLEFS